MKSTWILAGLCTVVSSHLAYAGVIFDGLSPADQEKILSGKQVVYYDPVAGSPWFQARVFQRVESSPVETAAVFFDYERYVGVIHRIDKAQVVETDPNYPARVTVDFSFKLAWPLNWIFDNPTYRVQNSVSCEGSTYSFSWKRVESEFLKEIFGGAMAEPLGSGTLVAYTNYIEPTSHRMSFAFVAKKIRTGSEKALQTIEDRIRDLKKNHPQLLADEVRSIQDALERSGFTHCL